MLGQTSRSSSTKAPRLKVKHFPHIQGLRAIAVLSVLLFHLDANYLPGGFIGVDVFFVISGFVISHSLSGQHYASFLSFAGHFYSRRDARIVPALLVCLLCTTLLSVLFIPGSTTDEDIARTGVFAFFGLSNLPLSAAADTYFNNIDLPNPFLHTWSLGVEEQFYLIFPFLLYPWVAKTTGSKSTRARHLSIGLFTGGLLVSLLLCAHYTEAEPRFAFYSMSTRFWELATGVILYQLYSSQPACTGSDKLRSIIGYSSVVLLALSFLLAEQEHFPFPTAILPVIATAGLIYCLLATPASRGLLAIHGVLTSSPAQFIGCLLYTSPSPRDQRGSRMPSSA